MDNIDLMNNNFDCVITLIIILYFLHGALFIALAIRFDDIDEKLNKIIKRLNNE